MWRERGFLEAAGFEVRTIEGLGLEFDRDIGALAFEDVRGLARRVHRTDADAVFLSCTNLPALPILGALEEELGCPVLSSNAATIWHSRRLLRTSARATSLGTLLAE